MAIKSNLTPFPRGGEPCSQSGLAERLGAKQSDIARVVSWLHDFGYIAVQAVKGGKEKPYIMADRLFAQFYRMRYLQPGQQAQLAILAEFLADALEQREKFNFAERYWLRGQEPEARMMLALALQDNHIDVEQLPETYRSTEQLMRVAGQIFEPREKEDFFAGCEKLLAEYNTDENFCAAYRQAYEVLKICNRLGDDLSGQRIAALIDGNLALSPIQRLWLFRFCVAYDCKEEKLREFLTKIEQYTKNIEELKAADLVQFQKIVRQHELNKQFPLAASYEALAEYLSRGSSTSNTAPNPEKSLQLYITALQHRLKNAQLIEAKNVLAAINRIAIQLNEQEQYRTSIDALSETLKIAKPALNHCIELINCIDSLALANLGLKNIAETLELFKEALKLAREQNETTKIAYFLSAIAEIKGFMGQTEKALIYHREALSISQTLQNEVWIALNIGQIARYALVKQGLNAAWQELAGAKSLQPTAQHSTVEHLAYAIDDISQQQGLPVAFAVANQLLAELPAYFFVPYEPFIRALWIRMVELQLDKKLLRDLTDELIPLYGASMQPLADLLKQWLDYLDMPTEQREDYLSRLNPDLAATLRALGEFE